MGETENINGADALSMYIKETIETESSTLNRLVAIVSDSVRIEMVDGKIVSSSNLTSSEMEILVMKIPAECLRIQASLNQYTARNVLKDIETEVKITAAIASMIGEKGNAEERKRKAEAKMIKERTISAANKAIVKGLQASIDRADKVYEGIKKVMDYRAREGWFDRKGPQ